MINDTKWLGLLGPVPAKDGQCRRRVMHEAPFEDWVEVRLVLDGGATGMRVVTAMFDADDRPGSVSDLVATEAGKRQEAVSGKIVNGGRIQGTYRLMQGDKSAPRPINDTEEQGLRALAAALRQRYP